ncbi:3-isopropylmalate dehydrogenase [Burkholderia sp. ABCPW 14]|uniref:3-isopropylmalate dehydrogenase n=1 Tax=Burkholderia sp. ABCPW 14 TaxID=1637860 RepID=UPI000770DB3A|nr:3-isopropylmalate dehydrogenase [Burkholderia sp. ABCPW 14]KVD78895.1 3-isopropylmalate dehydrogenase [Burkholderia sp. ABCPW 14]
MTHPLLELPRLFRPRRDRAGKQAGTTDDDQIFVIVFVMMMILPTRMARVPARASLPWGFKTGEIREVSAIA